MALMSILCIACFPLNPLVLGGLVKPAFFLPAYILGWVVWVAGLALVSAPFVLFPRIGGVPHGKSFVRTTRLVSSSIYAVVRHPQYLGGILSIFVATPLLYPHWLFVVLGIPGALIVFYSSRWEDSDMLERFGDEFRNYRDKVPGMNLALGVTRLLKHRRSSGGGAVK
jgi:protein-S-isoprenylcysteine O-methyltransferase Ste14